MQNDLLGQGVPGDPGFRLRPQTVGEESKLYIAKDFYIYQEDFSGLAASTSATGTIRIQADSDFILQKLTYFADIAAAIQTDSSRVVPLVTLQVIDAGSGRNLLEAPAPISSLFGEGDLPFILPTPRVFFARSNIELTVANFSAATTYNVRLSFIGYKAYPKGMY